MTHLWQDIKTHPTLRKDYPGIWCTKCGATFQSTSVKIVEFYKEHSDVICDAIRLENPKLLKQNPIELKKCSFCSKSLCSCLKVPGFRTFTFKRGLLPEVIKIHFLFWNWSYFRKSRKEHSEENRI